LGRCHVPIVLVGLVVVRLLEFMLLAPFIVLFISRKKNKKNAPEFYFSVSELNLWLLPAGTYRYYWYYYERI
jgi:predicted branched-subunit amino acid permease